MNRMKAAAVVAGVVLALGGASAPAMADAGAEAAAVGSPGILSGNVLQLPIHAPLNLCGNSLGLIALLNPAAGNACLNG
ncbi:chaplin [Streptomyces sp. NPDC002187]|uniref:chaplin n=1 Tax=Streptomyces sp. NPDC002187 TaxID=3364637 RepID=UPI00368A77C9